MEVFWVERGTGWHDVNGVRQRLEAGMLILIRQSDVHGFSAARGETFTAINVSFPSVTLRGWNQRYFSGRAVFFWEKECLPCTHRLDVAQLQRLEKWTEHLASCPNERLQLDWFLLDLFHALQPGRILGATERELPVRLGNALEMIRKPDQFSGGVRTLAKLAGCSLQHLNRELKKHGQPSAGEVVTEVRLQYAARQLRLSNRKIVDIALDLGLNNLGHFYQIFRRRFGLTPRQFRVRQQLTVGHST